MSKEKFLKDAKIFIDSGLIEKIYDCDTFSVYNVANVGYYVFSYHERMVNTFEYPVGIAFSVPVIDEIINDHNKLTEFMAIAGEEYMKKYSVLLSPKALDMVANVKSQKEISGPGPDIDFDWEERIKNRSKSL